MNAHRDADLQGVALPKFALERFSFGNDSGHSNVLGSLVVNEGAIRYCTKTVRRKRNRSSMNQKRPP